MLVSCIIGFSFLLLLFMFLGAKLDATLKDKSFKIIFWVLLFISYLTVVEIIFCIFLYVKFRNKDGEEGPRGFQGHPGDEGDPGKCNQDECRKELLVIMMAKMFEKKLKRKLNNEENDKLFDKFQTILNDRYTRTQNLYLKNIDGDTNILLKNVDLEYLKRFSEKLSERIELGYISIIDIPDSEPITGELALYFPKTA